MKLKITHLPFAAILIFLLVTLSVAFNLHKWKKNEVLRWDVFGYHNYLPALLIYQDFRHMAFIDSIDAKYKPTGDSQPKYGLYQHPVTGYYYNQYPCGTALLQSPFFLIAHAFNLYSGQDPPDGYSAPYQHANVLATIFYACMGLFILILFLRPYCKPIPIFITLLILGFGTNLYTYTAIDSGYSHPYAFFLFSCVLLLTQRFYQQPKLINSLGLGLILGLVTITRPIDIIVVLIPLFWWRPKENQQNKFQFLWAHKQYILLALLGFVIGIFPQLAYWKYVSGNWILYSYSENDYFEFVRNRTLHGLFSFRKGWFIYTPLITLGFIGMFLLRRSKALSFYQLPFWVFFIPMIYMVFSWHNWFYGWSFGARAMIDTLPVLALPMAISVQWIFEQRVWKIVISNVGILFLITLNLFQSWQYHRGILHGTFMNAKYYGRIFGKTEINAEDEKLLNETIEHDQKYNW
ncbi:MAG: hypothetical protein JNJ58_14070 [Chitinophagaceae bacterium]|nr:hypothetical protein [Chitinophagaceae bacterium]